MRTAFIVAEVLDDPQQEYLDMDRKITKVSLKLPKLGKNKIDTLIEYHSYKQDVSFKRGDILQIMDAQVRHDYKERRWWLTGGSIETRVPPCPPSNYFVFTGRVMRDLDPTNPMDCKATDSGLIIVNSAISVVSGSKESDIIPFVAINNSNDRYKPANLLMDLAGRKGMGLTIIGSLQTDSWNDKETGEAKYKSMIRLRRFTMAPKNAPGPKIEPRVEIPAEAEPQSLWLPAQDTDEDPF